MSPDVSTVTSTVDVDGRETGKNSKISTILGVTSHRTTGPVTAVGLHTKT